MYRGPASSASFKGEVIRDALRTWMRKQGKEQRELEELRAAIKLGLESGPGIPAEDVYAELDARYAPEG